MLIVDLYFNWANQTTNQKITRKKTFYSLYVQQRTEQTKE